MINLLCNHSNKNRFKSVKLFLIFKHETIFRRAAEKKVEEFYANLLRRNDFRSQPLVISNGPDPDLYEGGRGSLAGRGGKGFADQGIKKNLDIDISSKKSSLNTSCLKLTQLI